MKKFLFLIGIVVAILGINIEVKADVQIVNKTCTYGTGERSITFNISHDYGVSVGNYGSGFNGYFLMHEFVNNSGNISWKYWECPATIYYYCDENECYFLPEAEANTTAITKTSESDTQEGGVNDDLENEVTDPTYGTGIFGTCTKDGCEGTETCPPIFGSANDPESLAGFLSKYIFVPIRYLTPIVLIVMTSIDFAKAVFVDEKDGMGKAKSNFIKRGLTALIIFLAPTIVMTLFTLLDGMQISSCLNSNDIGGL